MAARRIVTPIPTRRSRAVGSTGPVGHQRSYPDGGWPEMHDMGASASAGLSRSALARRERRWQVDAGEDHLRRHLGREWARDDEDLGRASAARIGTAFQHFVVETLPCGKFALALPGRSAPTRRTARRGLWRGLPVDPRSPHPRPVGGRAPAVEIIRPAVEGPAPAGIPTWTSPPRCSRRRRFEIPLSGNASISHKRDASARPAKLHRSGASCGATWRRVHPGAGSPSQRQVICPARSPPASAASIGSCRCRKRSRAVSQSGYSVDAVRQEFGQRARLVHARR